MKIIKTAPYILAAVIFFFILTIALSHNRSEKGANSPGNIKGVNIINFDIFVFNEWWTAREWGEDLVSKEITELTGVSFKMDAPTTVDEARMKINLMISSNSYPDMIMMGYNELIGKLIRKNALLPLDRLINKYGEDIKKNVTMDYLKSYCVEYDGQIYGLPNGFAGTDSQLAGRMSGMLVLESIYRELGTPALDTIEDLYKYLLDVRRLNRKRDAANEIIPMYMDSPCANLAGAFGEKFINISGGSYVCSGNGTIQHVVRNKQMLEIFKFTNRLFREKLIDQEWFMKPREKVEENLKSGKIAVYFSIDAYKWLTTSNFEMETASGDRYVIIKSPSLNGKDAVNYNYITKQPFNKVYLTSECKDPVKAVEFLNWLASDYGQYASRLGAKGRVWKTDNRGKPYITNDFTEKLNSSKIGLLSELGYGKWCWQQNMKHENEIVTALLTKDEKHIYSKNMEIIKNSTWYIPELDNIYIDSSSLEGVANTNINIYFEKLSKSLYIAKNETQFYNLFDTMIFEMDNLGLEVLEDEINNQIEENRMKANQ